MMWQDSGVLSRIIDVSAGRGETGSPVDGRAGSQCVHRPAGRGGCGHRRGADCLCGFPEGGENRAGGWDPDHPCDWAGVGSGVHRAPRPSISAVSSGHADGKGAAPRNDGDDLRQSVPVQPNGDRRNFFPWRRSSAACRFVCSGGPGSIPRPRCPTKTSCFPDERMRDLPVPPAGAAGRGADRLAFPAGGGGADGALDRRAPPAGKAGGGACSGRFAQNPGPAGGGGGDGRPRADHPRERRGTVCASAT